MKMIFEKDICKKHLLDINNYIISDDWFWLHRLYGKMLYIPVFYDKKQHNIISPNLFIPSIPIEKHNTYYLAGSLKEEYKIHYILLIHNKRVYRVKNDGNIGFVKGGFDKSGLTNIKENDKIKNKYGFLKILLFFENLFFDVQSSSLKSGLKMKQEDEPTSAIYSYNVVLGKNTFNDIYLGKFLTFFLIKYLHFQINKRIKKCKK